VSPKGHARHGPRIKIAVDPPTSFDPTAKTASMAIHDGSVEGELASNIAKQAKQFIDLNRDALLLYWHSEIDTDELLDRQDETLPLLARIL
jgi:hypothetical protein